MSVVDRVKQALLGIGLLTVVAGVAFAGLLAYVWWDSQTVDSEIETNAEFDADDSIDADDGVGDVSTDPDDAEVGAD